MKKKSNENTVDPIIGLVSQRKIDRFNDPLCYHGMESPFARRMEGLMTQNELVKCGYPEARLLNPLLFSGGL
jgi:hypothetical protein